MLVAVLSGIAIWETFRGFGPFASVPANEALLLLQVFMGTVSVMVISAGALVKERERVEQEREHWSTTSSTSLTSPAATSS